MDGDYIRKCFTDLILAVRLENRQNIAEFSFKAHPSFCRSYLNYLNSRWHGAPYGGPLKAYGVLVVEDLSIPEGSMVLCYPDGTVASRMSGIKVD